jgi:hypothetical protein
VIEGNRYSVTFHRVGRSQRGAVIISADSAMEAYGLARERFPGDAIAVVTPHPSNRTRASDQNDKNDTVPTNRCGDASATPHVQETARPDVEGQTPPYVDDG